MEETLRFEYYVKLKEGYRPVMQDEEEIAVRFVIKAKNRATADRAVKALLKGSENVDHYDGVCID